MGVNVNRRDKVREAIDAGNYTKAEIAETLDMTVASVSFQMTVLRWQGHFIKQDEKKNLSFCTEEEYKEVEGKKVGKQCEKLTEIINRQQNQIAKHNEKLELYQQDLISDSDNEDLQDLANEAGANIVLLKIKLARNKRKLKKLQSKTVPEPEFVVEVVEAYTEEYADENKPEYMGEQAEDVVATEPDFGHDEML